LEKIDAVFSERSVSMALPVDVWRVVAGHLVTERDLCALACVSRELRGAVDDDAVWRRLFNRRYELEFNNQHHMIVGSSTRCVSSPFTYHPPSADDPHPERWFVRVTRTRVLAEVSGGVYASRTAYASRNAHDTRSFLPGWRGERIRGDGWCGGLPWQEVRQRTYREWTKECFFVEHAERVRDSYRRIIRTHENVQDVDRDIKTKLKQLETLARKEAIVKDAPDNRVRRRSQKLKDIAHQAKCVNNSLEKRAEDRKEYERKRLYELSRAPSEAVRMWKKATMERDKR
jgi:hypothetical protein